MTFEPITDEQLEELLWRAEITHRVCTELSPDEHHTKTATWGYNALLELKERREVTQ